MSVTFKDTDSVCGTFVSGIDLTKTLSANTVAALRAQWLRRHILIFPDQVLTVDQLESFSQYFGDFGDDPFIAPINGREHVIAVERRADEKAPVFAEVWHTDWSFQKVPPAGTCLYGITIPPVGGETSFINQHAALDAMPEALRSNLEGKLAIHSAATGYAPDGLFGDLDAEADRSMRIIVSETAKETQTHLIIRPHPESGRPGIFGILGYIIGIEGVHNEEAKGLLMELYAWQTREEFVYQHHWQENMLVMWDNRSVLHKANGGYDGYDRLLHRTTIADAPLALPAEGKIH
ncbi:MAG: taurine dioxygenase [Candidatus Azotimanducaceae bacterium]|jgi:taurine dioxygenase